MAAHHSLGPQFKSRGILNRGDGSKVYYQDGQEVPGPFTIEGPQRDMSNRGNLLAQMHDRSTTVADAAATAGGYADASYDDYGDYDYDYDD